MFRLWFLTFFVESRGPKRYVREKPAHGGPAHGHGVHESPWVMLAPLVILAVLSVVGGWVGVPHALGGHNQFGAFLEPLLGHPEPAVEGEAALGTERLLALVSVLTAIVGGMLAWLLYVRQPALPERIASALGGLYTTVRDKYYVDEAYQAIFVKPLIDGSRGILWRGVDVAAIDGAVNGLVRVSRSLSGTVRRMQSGNIRSYAGWVALGAAAVLAYMLFVGVR
jgi:NADH-quinone oxidoreductase subunit L